MSELASLLQTHLLDWRSGWSMGSFGAIAEFHQDEGEVAVINDPADLTRATRRGAIRIERAVLPETSPVAYETLSPKRHRWSQAVALCLPEELARRRSRDVLTELGPDDDAVRGIDRTGILFDMGLGLPQCDFCIRTSEPKLLAELRANLGRSLFEHNNTAMGAILKAHPHRVALTNIGRVEVYQKIGGPDTGGVSPPGPHTHVLPKLLTSRRTHSANTPIPDGYVPLGNLHPGSPVVGPMGEERTFDPELFQSFQRLLHAYGLRSVVDAKSAVFAALDAGLPPEKAPVVDGRFERGAVRLALRQQRRIAQFANDTATIAFLDGWLAQHDPHAAAENEDDDALGH